MIQSIIIQGSLTWFKEGLDASYQIIQFISIEIMPVHVYILGENITLVEKEHFITHAMEKYREKYECFQLTMGGYHAKILPSDVYKYRRKKLSKNPLIKLMRLYQIIKKRLR